MTEDGGWRAGGRGQMRDNGGCELPCWWSITPGETSWKDAVQFFADRGVRVWEESGTLDLKYPIGQGWENWMYVDMAVDYHQEEIVQIAVRNNHYSPLQDNFTAVWQHYALQPILSRHGVPSQVYLQ